MSAPTDEPPGKYSGVLLAVLVALVLGAPVMAGAIGFVIWLLSGGD